MAEADCWRLSADDEAVVRDWADSLEAKDSSMMPRKEPDADQRRHVKSDWLQRKVARTRSTITPDCPR